MSGVDQGAPSAAGGTPVTTTGFVTVVGPRSEAPAGDLTSLRPIKAYAAQLRLSLAGRSDVDDLVDEVVDHLLESASRLQRGGMDGTAAAEESLTRFGDPELVARAYRTTLTGGTAMPTTFTRAAGAAGLATAVAVAVLTALTAVSTARAYDSTATYGDFGLTTWVAASAAVLVPAVVLILGLSARTGLAHGRWLAAVLVPLALAVVAFAALWWAYPLWGSLLSLAALAIALKAHRPSLAREGGSTWPLWLLSAAWPSSAATLLALEPLGLGPVDSFGGHPLHSLIAALVAAALAIPAATRAGWWLASETATSRQHTLPLAPA